MALAKPSQETALTSFTCARPSSSVIQTTKYRASVLSSSQAVVAELVLLSPTVVSNGPSGELPARISAVKPGVSVVSVSAAGAPSASSTRPTPGFENAR
jgi:hypothetical protein